MLTRVRRGAGGHRAHFMGFGNKHFVCNVSYVSDDWRQSHDEWKKVHSGPSVRKALWARSVKNPSGLPQLQLATCCDRSLLLYNSRYIPQNPLKVVELLTACLSNSNRFGSFVTSCWFSPFIAPPRLGLTQGTFIRRKVVLH